MAVQTLDPVAVPLSELQLSNNTVRLSQLDLILVVRGYCGNEDLVDFLTLA